MIDDVRGAADRALAQRHWERILYLTNLTMIVVVIAVYLFSLLEDSRVRPLLAIVLCYVCVFVVWAVFDGLGLASRSTFVRDLYEAPGLGWMDASLAALAAVVAFFAWRLEHLNEPTALVTGLVAINGVLGYFQLRSTYGQQVYEVVEQDVPPVAPTQSEDPHDEPTLRPDEEGSAT